MKIFGFSIEASSFFTLTTCIVGSLMNLRWIEIEENGQIRFDAPRRQQRQPLNQFYTNTSRISLISDAGIEAAIGNHQFSLVQRGDNQYSKMLGAVSLKEEGFRQGSDCQFGAIEYQVTYLHSEGRTTRFARTHIRYTVGLQPALQQLHLRGLTSAVQPLKSDQSASAHALLP